MSRLSILALVLVVIGTFLVILSLFLSSLFSSNISPILFISIMIISYVLISTGLLMNLITRNEYHIIGLKNDFPLKLNHLIIIICAMLQALSFTLSIDINNYIYTGKFTYFSIITIALLLLIVTLAISKKHFKKNILEYRTQTRYWTPQKFIKKEEG